MTKTAILLIATGNYDQFAGDMVRSIRKFWQHEHDIFLFTDQAQQGKIFEDVKQLKIPHDKWPGATMFRYHYFLGAKAHLMNYEYLFYCDIDALFVDNIGDEILGHLVGVQHCGYWKSGGGSYEQNPQGYFYRYKDDNTRYYGGGFQGGKTEDYFNLMAWCKMGIEVDLCNNHVPVWHDETALNAYLNHVVVPDVVLGPEYHFTESTEKQALWGLTGLEPKILLLEKDHAAIRQ